MRAKSVEGQGNSFAQSDGSLARGGPELGAIHGFSYYRRESHRNGAR